MGNGDTHEIHFQTPGGSGPITWGQRAIWRFLVWLGDGSHLYNFQHVLAVPSGRSIEDVAEAIGRLVQRHHGLVTRFPGYATDPCQEVAAHGAVSLMLHTATADEAGRVATRIAGELAGYAFRHEEEWPVRFALVLIGDAPSHLVVVVSHLAVDGGGFPVLLEDLGLLVGGSPLPPDEGTWTPLALVEHQQGPGSRARHAAAMRHWRTEMLECPRSIFDVPELPPESVRFCGLRMVSAAAAVAVDRMTKAYRCSSSAVVLAAIAVVLSRYTGHRRVPIQLIASNRWRPEVLRTVASLMENGLFSVTVGHQPFGELVELTWKRALACYQTAAYDPRGLEAEVAAVQRLRGARIDRGVLFNDLRRTDGWSVRPQAGDIQEALADLRTSTTITPAGRWNQRGPKVCFYCLDSSDRATIAVEFDTVYLSSDTVRQMLTGVESMLIEAASRSVPLDDVGAVIDLVPVDRGTGWVPVDGAGWVHLGEVARLVAEAPSVARCAVFTEATAAGRDAGRLVAYLVAVEPGIRPAQIHDEVCALIRARVDVIAPQHYVLCELAPAGDDHAAWRSQPVLVSGSGRAGGHPVAERCP